MEDNGGRGGGDVVLGKLGQLLDGCSIPDSNRRALTSSDKPRLKDDRMPRVPAAYHHVAEAANGLVQACWVVNGVKVC